jgi:hypothetical protein
VKLVVTLKADATCPPSYPAQEDASAPAQEDACKQPARKQGNIEYASTRYTNENGNLTLVEVGFGQESGQLVCNGILMSGSGLLCTRRFGLGF